MNYKIPGLFSILLVFIAMGIADYKLFTVSNVLGIVFTTCIPISILVVLFYYCRKCPHVTSKTCRHVIFGWIVYKLFKPIEPSNYTLKEILAALIPISILVLFAQYWLFQSRILFIAFWLLILLAVLIIRIGVCPGCKNENCSLCPNANKL